MLKSIIIALLFAGSALAQSDLPSPIRALPDEPHSNPGCVEGWDKANAFVVGFCAPATGLTANQVWTWPNADGTAGNCWGWSSAYVIGWISCGGGITLVTTDPTGACTNPTPMQYNYTDGLLWGCDAGTWVQQLNTTGNQTITGPETFNATINVQTILPTTNFTYNIGSPTDFFVNTYSNSLYGSFVNILNLTTFDGFDLAYNLTTQNLEINEVLPMTNKIATFSSMLGAGIGTSTWYQTIVPYINNGENLGSPSLYWDNGYINNLFINSCTGSGCGTSNLTLVTSDPGGGCTNPTPMQYNYNDGWLWGCDAGTWAPQMNLNTTQTVTAIKTFNAQVTMGGNIIPNPTNTYTSGDTSHIWLNTYSDTTYSSAFQVVNLTTFDGFDIDFNPSTQNLEINEVLPLNNKIVTFSSTAGAGIGTTTWYQTLVPYLTNGESLGSPSLYWDNGYISNVFTGITGSTQCVEALSTGQLQGTGFVCPPTPGAWATYSPTFTTSGSSISVSATNCRYSQFGKQVSLRCYAEFTLTGTNIQSVSISLPVSEKDDNQSIPALLCGTSGSCAYNSTVNLSPGVLSSGTVVYFQDFWIPSFTFQIYVEGVYEAS